jgi:prepilin peptidase CpaA
MVVQSVAFAALNGAALWWDLQTRRIPNAITLLGVIAALILRAGEGLPAIADGLLGAGIAFAVALPLFALGAFGGGDLKLLVAVGTFMGPARLLGALLLIAVLGGVFGVMDALRRGTMLKVLQATLTLIKHLVTFGHRGARETLATPGADSIPYGVPIAIGALLWWFVGGSVV